MSLKIWHVVPELGKYSALENPRRGERSCKSRSSCISHISRTQQNKTFWVQQKRAAFRAFKSLHLEIMSKNLEPKSPWGVWSTSMNKV